MGRSLLLGVRTASIPGLLYYILKLTKGVQLKGVIQNWVFGKPWFIGCP